MSKEAVRHTARVLSTPIDVVNWSTALSRISAWARARESRYVCLCNAHSVVTASQDSSFNEVLQSADMATPDGASVAWLIRRTANPNQERIDGPDLMWRYCGLAAQSGEAVFLLGSAPDTLKTLQRRLVHAFPGLRICGAHAPPFRSLTDQEDGELVARINASSPAVVFVSLGCPKQERWMAQHRGTVSAVMIGVGAAFDFHAGTVRRAPPWVRNIGLEWLHRLLSEPRRLWRRYLFTNSAFVVGALKQLVDRWLH